MSSYIEQILQKLLTPDSAAIKQATKQLLDYFVSDKCINGLLEVLKTSQITQNRIYAATLLRKKVKSWKVLKQTEQISIRSQVIEIMVKEPEETVRKQIMYLIASVYKYSFKCKQEWPDLFTFIQELIVSQVLEQHLAGMFILSILNEEATEEMKPHFLTLFKIFTPILSTSDNFKSIFYVLSSLKNVIPLVSNDELNDLKLLVPDAIKASIKIINANQDQDKEAITTAFDFFHSIIEYEINIVTPYLTNLIESVLQIISDQNLINSTRICALNYINFLIETQKLNLIKTDMLKPIVNTVFTLMCNSNAPLQTKSDMEIDDDDDEENSENLFTCSTQIEYVNPAVRHENPLYRRAAFAALAVTSEGCADYYRNHYLELLVDLCIKGVFDADIDVVSTSFFALCQFSEYLQPNITHYAARIMQIFIQYIEQNPQIQTVSRLTVRFYDALQSFCENLGEDLNIYLESLMSKLMVFVSQNNLSLKIQRLIICTFSSIVTSVKSSFDPYFDAVVQMIKPYLAAASDQQQNEEQFELKLLQIECIDLMGILAKYMSSEKFSNNLINDCLLFVQHVLANDDDADKRSAVYDLLAGLTNKLKENLPVQQLIPQIIETLKSEEGINIIDADDKKGTDGLFSAFDEIDLEDDENLENDDNDDEDIDDEDDSQKFVIENEYVAEKLSALYCLQEASKYQNPHLIEYYKTLIDEASKLSVFVHLHIRKESYLALAKLISYYHDYCKAIFSNFNDKSANYGVDPKHIETLTKDLNHYFGNCIKAIECDGNRQLVMSVFDSLSVLLNRCAPFIRENYAIFNEILDKLGNLVIEAFKNKIFCQTVNQDEDEDDQLDDIDENQAEYDYMIKEYAGDLLPALALCLPYDLFDKYFDKVLQFLYRLINKPESTVAEKSFVIGVIGETISNLDNMDQFKAVNIFKGLRSYAADTDEEVRSNTIFTIGVLCSQSNGALKDEYESIIKDLLILLNTEKSKQTLDNICGTLCRICYCGISVNLTNIDYATVLNKIFEMTPLKTDHNEYFTLFTLINNLQSNNLLLPHYPKIIELSGYVLHNRHYECKDGIQELIVKFLHHVNSAYTQDLISMLERMRPEYSQLLRIAIGI